MPTRGAARNMIRSFPSAVSTASKASWSNREYQDKIDTKAYGALHALTDAAVKHAIESDPQLSAEERQRALKNMLTIVLASDRRVDITLTTTGQSSVRQFPFNAADALTLIGGREDEVKKMSAKPAPTKRTNNR